jgi:hypothetical protein
MVNNEQHNKYLAWAFIAHSGFQLLMTLFMMVMLFFVLRLPTRPGEGPPPEFLFFIFGFVALIQIFFVVPSFVAAYALIKKKTWARLAAIIGGVISAMNVPFGTVACVFALWFFLGENWKDVYSPPDAVETDRQQLASEMETRWSGMRTDERGEVTFNHVDPPDWR